MTLEETTHEFFFPLLSKFCAIMHAAAGDNEEELDLALSKAVPLYKKIERTEMEWRLGA